MESLTLDEIRADGATTTVERAGMALGISRPTAYKMVAAGTLPTIRVGTRALRVPTAQLIEMITGAKAATP